MRKEKEIEQRLWAKLKNEVDHIEYNLHDEEWTVVYFSGKTDIVKGNLPLQFLFKLVYGGNKN